MKAAFFLFILFGTFAAQAMELPTITVKDRVRIELWSLGMEKVSANSNEEIQRQPHLRPEIIKPLRDLVLEL